jgi:hypothetical protein
MRRGTIWQRLVLAFQALRGEEVHVAADVAGNDQFEGVRKCTALGSLSLVNAANTSPA